MTDISHTTLAKSTQQNADDYISGPRTITVTKVELTESADQPVAVFFKGDDGKPYLPCKTCRRVMVRVWGPNASAYVGRSMTIYRDDKVQFGGLAVGGIRISHMSHIDEPVTVTLQATRGKKAPVTVKPLQTPTKPTQTKSTAPASSEPADPSAPLTDDLRDWADTLEGHIDLSVDVTTLRAWFDGVVDDPRWDALKGADLALASSIHAKVTAKIRKG